jgi:hypothetical protein
MTTELETRSSRTTMQRVEAAPGPEPEDPRPPDDRSRFARAKRIANRIPIWAWAVAAFVVVAAAVIPLIALSGGGENNDRAGQGAANPTRTERPIEGSYVGKVSGGTAFIAVVVGPPEGEQDRRQVRVYIADGESVSESFSGSTSDNSFVAKAADGAAEVEGELRRASVKGSVQLEEGESVRYKGAHPGGAAGLYDLKLTPAGKLRGVSAAGLAVKGQISVDGSPAGFLKLADGTRLDFEITSPSADEDVVIGAGRVRLIVLPSGDMAGSAQIRPVTGDESDFFIRSA